MDAGSAYLKAQEAAASQLEASHLDDLQEYLPNASTNPILAKLQALPRNRIPPLSRSHQESQADGGTWEPTTARLTKDGTVERLTWSSQRVVWTLGDSIERIFDFDECEQGIGQSIRQALWADFPTDLAVGAEETSEDQRPVSTTQVSSARQEKARALFGPFSKPLADTWSDRTYQNASNSSASSSTRHATREPTLTGICIFLTDALHIVFPKTGQQLVLSIPFLLKRAWPLPDTGLLLERQLESDEEARQPVGLLDAPLPTLYTLKDIYEEVHYVSQEQQLSASVTPAVPRSQPFTDAQSDILLVSEQYALVVSFSKATSRIQLSRLAPVEEPEPTPPQVTGSPVRISRYTHQQSELENHPLSASRSATAAPQAGPSSTTAVPAVDRTFLGDGPAPEQTLAPDPAARDLSDDGTQHQSAAQCDTRLQVLWESGQNLDLRPDDQLKAVLFDERAKESFLAVHVSRSAQVYLYRLVMHKDESKIDVQEVRTEVAASIHQCRCTRFKLNDLLIVNADGQTRVLSSVASVFDIGLSLKEPRSARVTDHILQHSAASPQTTDLRWCSRKELLVEQCWAALSQVLSMEEMAPVFEKYLSQRNAKGDWLALQDLLLGAREPNGSEDLWAELLQSRNVGDQPPASNISSLLSDSAASRALQALHLVLQDCVCFHSRWPDAHRLGSLLARMAASLNCRHWQDYYRRSGYRAKAVSTRNVAKLPSVPDVFAALGLCLQGQVPHWPTLSDIAKEHSIRPSQFFGDAQPTANVSVSTLLAIYSLFSPDLVQASPSERGVKITEALHGKVTPALVQDLAFFVALPLREALRSTLATPPSNWSPELYEFLGRADLAKQAGGLVTPQRLPAHQDPAPTITQCSAPREDLSASKARKSQPWDSSRVDKRDLGLPLFHDRRLEEVGRMFRWSSPLVMRMPGVAADSGELPPANKQIEFVMAVAARTQSLPAGAALFTYRTRPPLRSNESLSIPDITLSVKLVPLGVQMGLDLAALPGERRRWPKFHSGVAMALQQNDHGASPFSNSNRAFSKPQRHDLDSRHAGYLMGLGLTGQIRSIAVFQVFEYLDPKHELTSIGILLGMSAAFVGTGDRTVSSTLAVHLSALHPSGSAELNISLLTQCAAMLGHGLLYMNTHHRTMADKILRELSRTTLQNKEQSEVCREAYVLSTGFAFGMIMLAHGGQGTGPEDEALLRRFKSLVNDDGQSSLLRATGKEGNGVDVSMTSPAATVALALMYLDSHRADVLDLVVLPNDEDQLDYIRPDLVLLRTIARCLIQLSAIKPTIDWVHSILPAFVAKAYRRSQNVNGAAAAFSSVDLELAYWNVVTGACYSIGLHYAGTASLEAHKTLSYFLDQLVRPVMMKQASLRGKLRQHSLQRSMNTILVALAMVFAGTGELHILQRLRLLHGLIGEHRDFGSHLAVHMSLGLLFLGGGRQTISSKAPGQLACLLVAFYPVWPRSSSDNQMHLQAFRHLWALAVEPRCLQVRDVDTDQLVHMPVRLHVTESSPASAPPDALAFKTLSAPTLIPELSSIRDIRIDSVRYWPVHLDLSTQTSQLQSLVENQTLYVKRHAGRLDYSVDPRGIKGINSRSGLDTETITSDVGHMFMVDDQAASSLEGIVASFSSDPHAVATLKYLAALGTSSPEEPSNAEETSRLFEVFASSVLMETLSADKIDVAPVYHHMFLAGTSPRPDEAAERDAAQALLPLRALLFVLDFYTSLTWTKLFSPPEAGARVPLIERAFVERTRLRLESELLSLLDSDENLQRQLKAYLKGEDTHVDAALARILGLLRCPKQDELQILRESVRSALSTDLGSDEGEDARSEKVQTAVQQTLQTVIPFSSPRDHWSLAQLVVNTSQETSQ